MHEHDDTATVPSTLQFRVRYAETDAMGIVHHGSYLAWFEMGRVELMRSLGHSYRDIETSGTTFPVIEARVRYEQPARFDEELTMQTFCLNVTRTRLRFGYVLFRDDKRLAHGYTEHAALGPQGRPVAIDEAFRTAVARCRPPVDLAATLRWSVRDRS